jgi:hypothetical protein
MKTTSLGPRRGDSGVTLLETIVVVVLSAVVIGGFALALTDSVDFTVSGVGNSDLQETGRRTLDRIKADMRSTGRFIDVSLGGLQMPHVFSNGQPNSLMTPEFAHDQAYLTQLASTFSTPTPASQPSNPPPFVAPGSEHEPKGIREIVFRLPADVDADGRIVSATTGDIEWSGTLVGYIVVPNAEGTLNLIRRCVTAGAVVDDVICRCVEAITFDSNDTKNILPLHAIEVHLHLLHRTSRGQIQRLHLATTAGMRNSP